MKNVIIILLFSIFGGFGAASQVSVTFKVDMSNEIVNTNGVHITGNFQDVNYDGIPENPSLVNWLPGVYELSDADMDGLYSITLQLISAVYEFKFINGNDWSQTEQVPPTCQVEVNGNDNRQMMVGTAAMNYEVCFAQCAACGESAVRFRVDMSTQPAVNPVGVHVAGNFQNPFADGDGSGDWDVDASPLQDWNGDNIWEGVYSVGSMTAIEYKFINGDDWANPNENVSGPCGPGNGNRTAPIESINTTLPSYCWNLCIECTVGCTNPIACNYNEFAITDDGSCFYPDPCGDCLGSGIAGCIDPLACNYNSIATCSDNSCAYPGCNNPLACNFNPEAGCDDGSCLSFDECGECGGNGLAGCTFLNSINYNPSATCDDGSCISSLGCTNTNACNYSPIALIDDGTCILLGATCDDGNANTLFDSYDEFCNCYGMLNSIDCGNDIIISEYVEGTGNNKAIELYNPTNYTIDLGQGNYSFGRARDGDPTPMLMSITGAIEPRSTRVFALDKRDPNGIGNEIPISNELEAVADTFVNPILVISNSPFYFNGDDAFVLIKSGTIVDIVGKIGEDPGLGWSAPGDPNAIPWTFNHTIIRKPYILQGVTSNPSQFDPTIQWDTLMVDDFSHLGWHTTICQDLVFGCLDQSACNYDPSADVENNSCIFPGCTDTNACNFTPDAGCDNGSCLYVNAGCNDSNAFTYNDLVDDACNCIGTNFNYGILAGQFQDGCCNLPMCPSNIPTMTLLPPLNVSQYQIQWYYKEGGSPWNCDQSSYTSWNLIEGATSMSYTPIEFYGTRSFRCLVTPSAEYNLNPAWAQGCGVLTVFNFSSQPIIGNPNITPFSTVTYAVNPIAGNTFNWTVTNGAIVSGQGTSVIQVLWGQNGPYQVSLSEGNGVCGDISNLIVVNSDCSLSAAISSTNGNAFCPGGTNELIASSNGTNLSYTWYLDGVEISGATEQSFGITSAGNYQVMVNDGLCSAVSQILNISQLPGVQWPEITVMEQNADCASASATITAAGGNATSYAWSSGETTPEITVTASGEYVLTVTNNSGCSAELPPVVINFAQSEAVPVCLVTVDSATGHNVIVWEPVTSEVTNAYVVYKETNVADVYEPIGTVDYGSDGIYEDINSNSSVQASRYKLALIDTCGIESSLTALHKTIHLTSNLGVGNTVNLIWSHYEGFAFGSYNIYRGTAPDNMELLTTIASNLNSYSDLLPLTNGYYMIEVEGVSCDPSRSVQTSQSNIINYAFIGVQENGEDALAVYPNPASDQVILICSADLVGLDFQVYNTFGQLLDQQRISSTKTVIQLDAYAPGQYCVKVAEHTTLVVKQ